VRVVTLEGVVATQILRELAACDAWYVFGVNRVVNRLQVYT
jgi:osmotically-inducible protein OsmY